MYRIVGVDEKEYGPVPLEQLKQWVAQGRVNAQTRVQGPASPDWTPASALPELAGLFPPASPIPVGPPPISAPTGSQGQQSGLAVTSLVLGIFSLLCFLILTGIPAIICGHVARSRARKSPAQYGGAGMALAGLILGYVSVVVTFLILPAMLLPAMVKAKERAHRISCNNNMHHIGMSFRMWAMDNGDQFPFNVSTNKGGTLELCAPGPDGFDRNSYVHFLVMSNELNTPKVLVCPEDPSTPSALDWASLQARNVTYQVHPGAEVDDSHSDAVLAVCPIHGNVLRCDGSVGTDPRYRKQR